MSWQDVFAGTCGGIAVTLVGHPFDTVKVRLQTQPMDKPIYNGVVDCVQKTVKVSKRLSSALKLDFTCPGIANLSFIS